MAVIKICDFCGRESENIIRLKKELQSPEKEDACEECATDINDRINNINSFSDLPRAEKIPLIKIN